MGIILDATRPYKTPTAPDFTTKIKIIDSTLNINSPIESDKKYLHIFLYSKSLNEAPDVLNIGDILYLKFYDVKKKRIFYFYYNNCLQFEKYGNSDEVKGRKKGGFSKFYVFDGASNDFNIKYTDNLNDPTISEETKIIIQEKRVWAREFFRNNSRMKFKN